MAGACLSLIEWNVDLCAEKKVVFINSVDVYMSPINACLFVLIMSPVS